MQLEAIRYIRYKGKGKTNLENNHTIYGELVYLCTEQHGTNLSRGDGV